MRAGIRADMVRLDPVGQRVGPSAPQPMARRQYDVGVRLSEGWMLAASTVSPSCSRFFLFRSTADDDGLVARVVGSGNDEPRDLRHEHG